MLVIRAYLCLGELQVTVNTTRGSIVAPRGGVIDPLLYSAAHALSEDYAPYDLSSALAAALHQIHSEGGESIYEHLRA